MIEDLKFKEALDSYGRTSDVTLFVKSFGVFPLKMTYHGLEPIDVKLLTKNKLEELFPESLYTVVYQARHFNITDEDDEEVKEEYSRIKDIHQLLNNSNESNVENIDIYFAHAFVNIGKSYISMYYDSTIGDPDVYLKNILDKLPHKKAEAKPLKINVVGCSNGDFYTSEEEINETHIDIRKNYNDDFLKTYERIEKFITEKERKSGVIFLRGRCGTGKTTAIRSLITNVPANYVYITPAIAAHLSEPDFTGFLLDNKNSIFILEDCEQVIMNREDISFQSAVASLLNMSDGLMSDIFNSKFICTFNCELDQIDKALLRPGRCIVNYEFKALTLDKTQALFKELYPNNDNIPNKEMTIAELYNEDVTSNIEQIEKPKFGF